MSTTRPWSPPTTSAGGSSTATLEVATCALVVVAFAGRYTTARAGLSQVPDLDLRLLLVPAALALVAHAVARRPVHPAAGRREGWLVVAVLLAGYQAASALWAPPGARSATVLDVTASAALLVGAHQLARRDPVVVVRAALWTTWALACAFALGAAAAGPGVQGRFSAFGGGPNVFVRVQVLGVIAACGLVACGGRRWLLASAPPLVLMALLSGSRGGLVAALAVGGAACLLGGPRVRRAAALGAATTGAALVAAYALVPPFTALVGSRFVEQTAGAGYTSGRPEIWAAALDLAVAHPLVGVGLDGFYAVVGDVRGVEHPHDYVLAVASEGGLVGLVLLVVAVTSWWRAVRAGAPWDPLVAACVAAAVYVALTSLASGGYYDARLAGLFAALAAAGAGTRTPVAAARGSDP